jgi:hypothetical protein
MGPRHVTTIAVVFGHLSGRMRVILEPPKLLGVTQKYELLPRWTLHECRTPFAILRFYAACAYSQVARWRNALPGRFWM